MNVGFIGGGNMGGAMMSGLLKAGIVNSNTLMASAKSEASVKRIAEKFQIEATSCNRTVAEFADVLFLAIKPVFLPDVVNEIKDMDLSGKVIVSVVAGQSLEKLESMFGKKLKLVRTMPNTPALVGEAMSAISPNEMVTSEEADMVLKMFESFGKAEIIPERLQDSVVGVSGSSPAYVYMFIEALADGAVAEGMPRAQAYKFASQAVLGAAKMVLETREHPGALKDAVCSPGGTTIEAVATLEAMGFRSAVIEAERVCTEKAKNL